MRRDPVLVAAFERAAVNRDGKRCCAVCGTRKRLRAHHVVPAQWLRRLFPELEWDIRNALSVCQRCHKRHHRLVKPVRIPRRCLRAANLEFIAEVGAEWLRDSLYPDEQEEAA